MLAGVAGATLAAGASLLTDAAGSAILPLLLVPGLLLLAGRIDRRHRNGALVPDTTRRRRH